MKKILLLLLFITGTLYAQPPIAQPDNLQACDANGDGFEVFDLTTATTQILNGLNANDYLISFYGSNYDANNDINSFADPSAYMNIYSFSQGIYVRVTEIANTTNYATTSFILIVNPLPAIVQPNDLTIYENPFDGSAIFDLTTNETTMLNGIDPSNVSVYYYMSLADAQSGANPIVNEGSFYNTTNPQTIYVNVIDNSTGCSSITNFDLIVVEEGIVYIPDVNFKAKLLAANENNTIASNVNPNNSSTWNIYSKVDINQDGEIQFSEANAIVYLNIDSSSTITTDDIQDLLGLEAFNNLKWLRASYNQIATVDLSVCPELEYFYATNSSISNLGLTNCNNLKILNCGYNLLSSVDLTQCPSLTNLVLRNNQLTSLNLDTNEQIQTVSVFYNGITSFQIQDKELRTLQIGFNQLTDLQLTNLPFLYRVEAQNNNLTSVDFSTIAFQYEPNNLPQANIFSISVNNNVNLNYINLKNGYTNINNSLSSGNLNDTQQYICVDENDTYEYFFTTPNPIANTYCSFTPGGDFNTISGVAQFDTNNDGCDSSDFVAQYFGFEVSLDGVTTNASIFTNSLGNYALFASQQGVYQLNPNIENPSYFTISPSPTEVIVNAIDNSTTTQNFCISANGVHPDLEIVIAPIVPARPGFDAVYEIVYRNKGNQVVDGYVNFTFDDMVLDFVSSSVVPNSNAGGTMHWFFPNLIPFENGSILVTFNVNSPTETPAVNIDDVLTFNAFIDVTTDETWDDNNFDFNQTVVGSFDPNDITCIEGEYVSPNLIGDYLHYVINFENTGTYEAENIVVKTEINSADYDINTLRLLNASHNVDTRIHDNIVEFIFQAINLDTGGHGNVLLKIKTKNDLVPNDVVSKRADIYFDYNAPVETNFASTTFQLLSTSVVTIDNSVGIYPNPAKDIVNIKAKAIIQSIEVYDVQGRIVQSRLLNEEKSTIDVSNFTNGIYFLKIKTELGEKVEKLIVE